MSDTNIMKSKGVGYATFLLMVLELLHYRTYITLHYMAPNTLYINPYTAPAITNLHHIKHTVLFILLFSAATPSGTMCIRNVQFG